MPEDLGPDPSPPLPPGARAGPSYHVFAPAEPCSVDARTPDSGIVVGGQLDRPNVGVSACLLGARVRFDGAHKLDRLVIDELGPLVEWVAVRPEVEVGMGIPRESVRLVTPGEGGGGVRMIGNDS